MRGERWRKYWASTAGSFLIVAQVVLWIVWGFGDIGWLRVAGIVLWWAGVVFAWVPIFQLKRRGGVAKGESYVRTTTLVDTGIYAIVRHPQFISWPLFSVALMLMVQRWAVVALGAVSMVLVYKDFRDADASGIEKFGDAYRDYMRREPGWNLFAGVWRWARRKLS
jgi:protein-S-isoprenylcysteine O-methyltransferase Ste14